MALLAARAGHDVWLWSYNGEFHQLDGVQIPENIRLTSRFIDVGATDVWIMVTPSAFFRETVQKAASYYQNQPVLICTKGLEAQTYRFMAEVLRAEIPQCVDIGVVSGPQFAAEVTRGVPTGSTLAGTDRARSAGRSVLSEMYLEETDDIVGTEICGVGKNAVALICGYIDVVARGENERAMILTRAWGEVVDFGLACGGQIRTFLGLAGIGDLFLSATSTTSRNFSGGRAIASGAPVTGTVEGIFALRGIISRGTQLGVDMPTLMEMARCMELI